MNTPTDKEIRDWYMGYGVEARAVLADVEGEAFDRYMAERDAKVGDEAYREGIAWERKRVEMAWHEEMACQCSNFEYHLLERIEEK